MMQKCIPKVFGLGGERQVGDLCLQIPGCANFASKQYNIAVQQSSSTAIYAVQYVMDFTFFCPQTDIAVLHPEDDIVRVWSGTLLQVVFSTNANLWVCLLYFCGSLRFFFHAMQVRFKSKRLRSSSLSDCHVGLKKNLFLSQKTNYFFVLKCHTGSGCTFNQK